jgi:hypothetical protein
MIEPIEAADAPAANGGDAQAVRRSDGGGAD